MLLQQFQQHLKENFPHLSPANNKFILTVSGGIDSIVLTDLFYKSGYDFIIAHCNFLLRGQESFRDELFMTTLKEKYNKEIAPQLAKEFNIENPMAIPRIEKIVVNMGMGEAISNSKILDTAVDELRAITGQKPVITKAKKSIASFKLRQGMNIGTMVTLRGERMYEFLDRLISVALPRVRDFRGVSAKAFDGRGNYTLGVREQLIFPEIDFNKVDKTRGMNISIVTTAQNDEQSRALLKALGMPFRQ